MEFQDMITGSLPFDRHMMNLATTEDDIQQKLNQAFESIGIDEALGVAIGDQWQAGQGENLSVFSPVDGTQIAQLAMASEDQLNQAVDAAEQAFRDWRVVPAPVRGELVRQIGNELRKHKEALAVIVTAECGKIYQEALGEVQEMIDICDFAVGQSRQLYGLSIASERPAHRLTEQWHPLGPIGVISAFNFPVAVWAWNSMLALACGDPVVWKPSEKTPLTAIACHQITLNCIKNFEPASPNLIQLVVGGADIGQKLAAHRKLPLVSATGSIPMGRSVAQTVASRLGRPLLELGGNNAAIVTPTANLDLAIRGIVFAAVGTCGQRCTSLRRLIVHDSIAESVKEKILSVYAQIPIGNPFDQSTLVGPLIDQQAYENMQNALERARNEGGVVHGGERFEVDFASEGAFYVRPAIVEISADAEILQHETFAPITYLVRYNDFEQAIELQNSVTQGLSSAVFTENVREAELFCSPSGSDCGIANVNIGTSGAEIGGAFGGEKDTGGGRKIRQWRRDFGASDIIVSGAFGNLADLLGLQ